MTESAPFLPYGRQLIEEDDVAAVVEVLRGDWLTTGPAVDRFEKRACAHLGADHAVACANGTAALHLAAMAIGLQRGDKAVVPSMTFLATANAATYVGAEVVFADCDPESGVMGVDDFEEALSRAGPGVRAVFPVHLTGQCADLEAIYGLAKSKGIAVIEDAAHAIGSRYTVSGGEERFIGNCMDSGIATFSLHPVKTVTMGEGGLVTTNDAALAERARRFRSHGMVRDPERFENTALGFMKDGSPNPWYYEMVEPGFNYRATDFQCALGMSQLGKLTRFAEHRRKLVAHYDQLLAGLNLPVMPIRKQSHCEAVWHLYAILIDFAEIGLERGIVMQRLRDQGIGTQVHYIPVHKQPYYERQSNGLRLPGTDRYYEMTLSLPLFAGMGEADVERVVEALRKSLSH